MNQTIVLAYSGGLDTSVCVKWLCERGYRVVAFMADVGQGEPSAVAIKRAKIAGASKVIVKDLRKEFVAEYLWPALKAGAVYEGKYLLATALSRPLIAAHLVQVAHAEKAQLVGHGCTGKGNDQVRFEVTVRILDPSLQIMAPVREWEFRSREEEIEYAQLHKIPIEVKKRSPYSIDQNLWGTSIEAGVLEDPWVEPPEDTYRSIRSPQKAQAKPDYVTVGFVKGIPRTLDGKVLKPILLIERLNRIGASHGVGRTDMIESRVVGIKSREVYEAPAAAILHEAHAELERMVL
ncbi:MAG: argininosuccinate synthase, partial [Candidatus Omnitrophica bacterium]|nr:argininosuccinate synthase [Candidatus Omnitrophota bacterium]